MSLLYLQHDVGYFVVDASTGKLLIPEIQARRMYWAFEEDHIYASINDPTGTTSDIINTFAVCEVGAQLQQEILAGWHKELRDIHWRIQSSIHRSYLLMQDPRQVADNDLTDEQKESLEKRSLEYCLASEDLFNTMLDIRRLREKATGEDKCPQTRSP